MFSTLTPLSSSSPVTVTLFASTYSLTVFPVTRLPSFAPPMVPSFSISTTYLVDLSVCFSAVTLIWLSFAASTVTLFSATFCFSSYNCFPLTASVLVSEISPSATLVIFLLPAFMPSFVTDGPSLMVSPSLSSFTSSPTLTSVSPEILPLSFVPSMTISPTLALLPREIL